MAAEGLEEEGLVEGLEEEELAVVKWMELMVLLGEKSWMEE